MGRLPLLDREHAPILSQRWYREDGSASALTMSLAQAPDVLGTLMPFLGEILGESSVDLAIKELVIMRVSHLNGCAYCVAAHRGVAREAGVSQRELDAVCERLPVETLSARERALIGWVDCVTLAPHAITDELLSAALRHVRSDELIELTVLVGAVTLLNQYCTAFDIPPPGVAVDSVESR